LVYNFKAGPNSGGLSPHRANWAFRRNRGPLQMDDFPARAGRLSSPIGGQTRKSTSSRSLRGPESESQASSTIGSDGWLLNIIALRSSFLAGLSTDRAAVEALRQQMNFLMPLSLGLAIQIHGSERHGKRVKDWRNSSRIVEPYWFWMAWSRSKIRLAPKKDGYVSPPYRPSCGNSLLSIGGFA
jgi:hypothetical protein